MLDQQERISALSHVLWISGSPCMSNYEVDGSRSLDEMTVLVENHLEPYIMQRLSQMEHL